MKTVWIATLALALACIGCDRLGSGYRLTSYKRGSGDVASVITLQHNGQTLKAQCKSNCDEYGAMVGQTLSCFVEPPAVDAHHPYGTKRPIFNALGGNFVCHPGKGRVYMVRRYACETAPSLGKYGARLEDEYSEDSLYVDAASLDKLYCKPGEYFHDKGGDTVTDDGTVLPIGYSIEWLDIVEAK